MGCFGECWDAGPPPDSILFIPPPPAPAFLQPSLPDLLLNTTPCSSAQVCEAWVNHIQGSNTGTGAGSGDYVELPRKDLETTWSVSNIDDTWLLVLVASSIGVLLLGALLAMFLLKCREMNIFGSNECSMVHSRDHRQIKNHEPRECSAINNMNTNKLVVHPSEAVLYTGPSNMQDNRMVWAALTPRGTQHFISENYPRNLIDYAENEDHYETIDNLNIQPVPTVTYNTCQKDYDYEDPTPLIESYQLSDIENRDDSPYYSTLGNTDMRCASLGSSYRRGIPLNLPLRPRVSSPTRIEHPNLPPLNLYPHKGGNMTMTLKRNNLTYRKPDNIAYRNNDNLLPKYGC
ncbi:hypothetical protein ILUMI_05858 [Ignelater luminosus]|uniref:Uncharacterized protein n=1 Tax=Ignelater luminosus TaxID=2038154 RepID=A0A8K0D6I5_IGNLU|nr:hypothetical protein ILUMI_05858 [Ignelater luminosus]